MQLHFMEKLLRIEAEAKYFLGATDRSYEQTLMDELLKIIEEAESLFGPRDRSYELLPPRISECGCAHPYVYLSTVAGRFHSRRNLDRSREDTQWRARAGHTHPQDELITVIEGTWYVGEGERFDAAKLKSYPAGSFIVIPAGLPHFVGAESGSVIVQVSGTGKFATDYLEK